MACYIKFTRQFNAFSHISEHLISSNFCSNGSARRFSFALIFKSFHTVLKMKSNKNRTIKNRNRNTRKTAFHATAAKGQEGHSTTVLFLVNKHLRY